MKKFLFILAFLLQSGLFAQHVGIGLNTQLYALPKVENQNVHFYNSTFSCMNLEGYFQLNFGSGFGIQVSGSLTLLPGVYNTYYPEGWPSDPEPVRKIPWLPVEDPNWIPSFYGDEYLYYKGESDLRQNKWGFLAVLNTEAGFFLRGGILFVTQKITLYKYPAKDEFYWAYSIEEEWDVYLNEFTYTLPPIEEKHTTILTEYPVYFGYNFDMGGMKMACYSSFHFGYKTYMGLGFDISF